MFSLAPNFLTRGSWKQSLVSLQRNHELPEIVCKISFDHFPERGYQAFVEFPVGSLDAKKVQNHCFGPFLVHRSHLYDHIFPCTMGRSKGWAEFLWSSLVLPSKNNYTSIYFFFISLFKRKTWKIFIIFVHYPHGAWKERDGYVCVTPPTFLLGPE